MKRWFWIIIAVLLLFVFGGRNWFGQKQAAPMADISGKPVAAVDNRKELQKQEAFSADSVAENALQEDAERKTVSSGGREDAFRVTLLSAVPGRSRFRFELNDFKISEDSENGKPYKKSGGKMVWNNKLKKEIPEEWTVLSLSQLSEIVNGATPSTETPNNYGGNIVWITPKDLSNQKSKFTFFGERNISQQGYDSCSTSLVGVDTILLSSRAPIGLLSIAKRELCTNQGFKSIEPYNKDNTPYLYYYIKEHIPQIEQLGSGTTFKEVSRGDIEGFPVMIPQEKVLSDWNKLIKDLFEKQYQLYTEVVDFSKMRDELLPMLMNGQISIKPLNNHLSAD